ncbi:hypothetical protein MTP99_004830 [Tenebrio molitor]|jgi:hypothetical protein|nr:hypothetical protein MTP99_007022 [Tenebrio molitor]KAJ3616306.1 hypothetical protein MTP99_004830 [Tenebrio molitor]
MPDETPTAEPAQIAAAVGTLPPLWNTKPELWFAIAEAKFNLAGITQEKTKYHHVLTVLSPEAANEVSDVIIDTKPSDETPYTKLKNAIITRLSQTETQKLKELLSNCELGSRKPTQLVRHMKTLVGAGPTKPVNDQVLRELFLQNMPHAMQPTLIALTTLTLDQLAEVADKIVEATPALAISAMNDRGRHPVRHEEPSLTTTLDAINNLADQVNRLMKRLEDASPRLGTSGYRTRSNSRGPKERACWYHHKFGAAAKKCVEPCNFQKNVSEEQN